MPEVVEIDNEYLNVAEAFTLTDTILISDHINNLATPVPGWFATWAAAGAVNKLSFFNVRNRAICDAAWNNQDTRDTAAYGMRILQIAVRFFGPMNGDPMETQEPSPYYQHHFEAAPLWTGYMPFNAGFILRVQQDEKLKANCAMLNSGAGVVVGGWGQGGQAASWALEQSVAAYNNQGVPHQQNKFAFPEVIDIPRRASVAAEVIMTDYARNLLAHQTGPGHITVYDAEDHKSYIPAVFGLQVEIKGRRLVQQRGQLHA